MKITIKEIDNGLVIRDNWNDFEYFVKDLDEAKDFMRKQNKTPPALARRRELELLLK